MEKAGILRVDCDVAGEKRVMVLASRDVSLRLRKLRSDKKLGKLTAGFVKMAGEVADKLVVAEVGRCVSGSEEDMAEALRLELEGAGYKVYRRGGKEVRQVVVHDKKHGAWIEAGVKAIKAGMDADDLRKLIEKEVENRVIKVTKEVAVKRSNGVQMSFL